MQQGQRTGNGFSQSLSQTVIVPVMVIRDAAHAVPLARALVAGGLNILEITLRTPSALDAMQRISAEVEGAIVGAGTVINRDQLAASTRAGAKFIVSPGLVEDLALAARDQACRCCRGWRRRPTSCGAWAAACRCSNSSRPRAWAGQRP